MFVFEEVLCARFQAAIAQLVARRSHNPKVVSSILTGRILPFKNMCNNLNRVFEVRTGSNKTELI
jgi:hypothetical protein